MGGSLIVPEEVDFDFLKLFVEVLKKGISRGENFAIITGGGKVCRKYNDALKKVVNPTSIDLDSLGIYATRLNAELVRICLEDVAEPVIFFDPTNVFLTGKSVLVGGGWKPGHSSDGSAVALAQTLGAKKLVNLSNIDYVYTDDPKKNPEAKKIEKINWEEFRKLLPESWNPGINTPFDPVAAKMAQDLNIEVAVMNGKNLENFENYLEGKEFLGTVIN